MIFDEKKFAAFDNGVFVITRIYDDDDLQFLADCIKQWVTESHTTALQWESAGKTGLFVLLLMMSAGVSELQSGCHGRFQPPQ